MRLCFLGDIRSTHIQKFIKYFSKKHETYLISFDYVGDNRVTHGVEFFKNINTTVYTLKKSQLFLSPFITKYIIDIINPDLVQAHFVTNYGFLGAFSGVHPLVISAMGDDVLIHPFQNKVYHQLVTYALNSADFITCDGLNSLDVMNKNFKIPMDKMILIYPGIDMTLFNPSKKRENSDRTVFYPRGFDKIYDTETLFLTFKRVHEILPDVKFVLLGVGTESDIFRDNIVKSGMNKSVSYLGHIPNDKLPYYLASADLSVTTSLSDGGIPVSTIEAMACGLPVVSTNVGDARLWVKDGEAGYIVEKQSPLIMADRIVDLLNNKDKRLRFGENARKIVETSQDYNLEMKKMEDLYMKLINN